MTGTMPALPLGWAVLLVFGGMVMVALILSDG